MFQFPPFSSHSSSRCITLKLVFILSLILKSWPVIAEPNMPALATDENTSLNKAQKPYTAILQDIASINTIETDAIEVDEHWTRIELNSEFSNPVVIPITEALNSDETDDSFMLGIRNTDADSFEIRLEMCNSSSELHIPVFVNYDVIESGEYFTTDGAQVETKRRFLWGNCITIPQQPPI